jgi:hypothetical protein
MASRSLLDRLGLVDIVPLRRLASMAWPVKTDVDSPATLDMLIANGHADPARFEPIPWSDEVAPGLTFLRSRAEPSLIRVEGPPVCSALVVGTARRVGADSLLFVAVAESALRLGSRLLSVEDDTLTLEELPSDEVEAQERSPSRVLGSHAAALVLGPRDSYVRAHIADCFAGIELADWLLDEACELAERGSLSWTAAALGLVSRLHEPTAEDPSALLAAVLASKTSLPSPRAHVRRWLDERSAHEINEIEREALASCDRAADALAALSVALEDHRPELAAMARQWIRLRDDLEAVREALTIAGRSGAIDAKLEALDGHASAYLSMLSQIAMLDGERWRAVSWQQPHLWWGGLSM